MRERNKEREKRRGNEKRRWAEREIVKRTRKRGGKLNNENIYPMREQE